jgi:hypothetical protein
MIISVNSFTLALGVASFLQREHKFRVDYNLQESQLDSVNFTDNVTWQININTAENLVTWEDANNENDYKITKDRKFTSFASFAEWFADYLKMKELKNIPEDLKVVISRMLKDHKVAQSYAREICKCFGNQLTNS